MTLKRKSSIQCRSLPVCFYFYVYKIKDILSENLSCCYPFLGSHTKNKKYKKYIYNNNNYYYYYYYYYYYLEGIQKNNRSEKRMLERP